MVLVGDTSDQEIDKGQVTDHEIHLMSEQSLSLLLVLEMGLHQHDSTTSHSGSRSRSSSPSSSDGSCETSGEKAP
ncbi:hypothetical protein U0070_000589 [Myodes glareolus]|uniref:Uncharacterized protein n=1 Tax=Myodes glareolus TaxID=447135 RepID=A0AAW0IJI3_MYOGA